VEWLLPAVVALTLTIDAPASLASAAARIRAIDPESLGAMLTRGGLHPPADVHVTLVPEDDPLARVTPDWILGRAIGDHEVVLFPARAARYPYDSLESVMRHEVVHLALFEKARGRPLPRWFHEGVATSVEAGWDVTDQLRLLLAALQDPSVDEVSELFRSESQPDTTLAYLLAAALVDDLRERHGPAVAGRIAARVSEDVPFIRAFAIETGETPNAAAARAWHAYRRWTNWVPAVANASTVWRVILVLALLAFLVQRRRRAERRRRWDEEESWKVSDDL
jgi:hypothetical protein